MRGAVLALFVLVISMGDVFIESAEARRTRGRLDRKLQPGWCAFLPDAEKLDDFVFTADGSSATITFVAHDELWLDNVFVVEEALFLGSRRPHDQAVGDFDCEFKGMIYDFADPGTSQELLELFDKRPQGWRFQDAGWTDERPSPATAPRMPFGPVSLTGGSIAFETGGTASVVVEGLTAGKRYVVGGWWYMSDAGCPLRLDTVVDTNALTLHDGRFEITATWRTGNASGAGHSVPISDVAGYFWLSNRDGADVTIKLLERCSINGFFAVSITGLVDREVVVTVEDTQTGRQLTHENPLGTLFLPFKDREAFPCP